MVEDNSKKHHRSEMINYHKKITLRIDYFKPYMATSWGNSSVYDQFPHNGNNLDPAVQPVSDYLLAKE